MHEKLILLFAFIFLSTSAYSVTEVKIKFYSETLFVDFDPEMKLLGMVLTDELSLMQYYEEMEKRPYQPLLRSLEDIRQRLRLNDWLYYELLLTAVQRIYQRESPLKLTLTCWFLLSQEGYDTRLTYLEEEAFLYVWSEEAIYEAPMILDQQRKYINLNSLSKTRRNTSEELNLLSFHPKNANRSFSFDLQQLPLLKPQPIKKKLRFQWKGEQINLTVTADKTIFNVMKKYPIVAEPRYLEVPLSSTLRASLLPQLTELLKGKSSAEALELLVAFTRSGFRYKEDRDIFGQGKPMIADELFHYRYSDCEDRAALFYTLVKQLLDLPMLIVAYPDHLTIAVAAQGIKGPAIQYGNRAYYVCDPTGPSNSCMIGSPPKGYERKKFEIIGTH